MTDLRQEIISQCWDYNYIRDRSYNAPWFVIREEIWTKVYDQTRIACFDLIKNQAEDDLDNERR